MNAINETSLKTVAAAVVAVLLTTGMSWSFVESTAVVRWGQVAATVVATASDIGGNAARVGASALLK
jgi:hypothetical protein